MVATFRQLQEQFFLAGSVDYQSLKTAKSGQTAAMAAGPTKRVNSYTMPAAGRIRPNDRNGRPAGKNAPVGFVCMYSKLVGEPPPNYKSVVSSKMTKTYESPTWFALPHGFDVLAARASVDDWVSDLVYE